MEEKLNNIINIQGNKILNRLILDSQDKFVTISQKILY